MITGLGVGLNSTRQYLDLQLALCPHLLQKMALLKSRHCELNFPEPLAWQFVHGVIAVCGQSQVVTLFANVSTVLTEMTYRI